MTVAAYIGGAVVSAADGTNTAGTAAATVRVVVFSDIFEVFVQIR